MEGNENVARETLSLGKGGTDGIRVTNWSSSHFLFQEIPSEHLHRPVATSPGKMGCPSLTVKVGFIVGARGCHQQAESTEVSNRRSLFFSIFARFFPFSFCEIGYDQGTYLRYAGFHTSWMTRTAIRTQTKTRCADQESAMESEIVGNPILYVSVVNSSITPAIIALSDTTTGWRLHFQEKHSHPSLSF